MRPSESTSPVTRSLHHRVAIDGSAPVVTPLFQNSAFEATSPFFYTRKANPNSVELEGALAILEDARHVISTTTGMSALSLALGLLAPGAHLVVNRDIYGCSHELFKRTCDQRGMRLTSLDLSCPEGIAALPEKVDMVLFETPTNPFLRTISIQAVAGAVRRKSPEALVVVDNTWATPLFQKPLQHGASISLGSATKFLSGHSDVMGGYLCVDDEALAERLGTERFYHGAILDPHSAWMLRRSLQTFPLRMREHVRVTEHMRHFLARRAEIVEVQFPDVDGDQLQNYGGIVFVKLRADLVSRYREFTDALTLFDTGTGMACVTSMVAQPWTGSHASMSAADKEAIGLGPDLVRLCFGLEDVADLERDLERAFEEIEHEEPRRSVPVAPGRVPTA